jgi:hypothetical protein
VATLSAIALCFPCLMKTIAVTATRTNVAAVQSSPPCMSTEAPDPVTGCRPGCGPPCRQRSLTTCASQSVQKSTSLRGVRPTYTHWAIAPKPAMRKRVVPRIVRVGPQRHERPLRPSSTQEGVADNTPLELRDVADVFMITSGPMRLPCAAAACHFSPHAVKIFQSVPASTRV